MVKEKFGLVTSHYAPITATPANSHPTYGPAIDLGPNVLANLTANRSQATLFGDDVLQLDTDEFTSATLQVETLLSDLQIEAALFSAAYNAADGLHDSADDNAVPGCYYYIQKLKTKTGIIYRGVFLYYAVPLHGDDNAQTKADNVQFINNALSFTVYADNTREWRARKDFDTQADAEAWLESLRGGSAAHAVTLEIIGEGSADPGAGTHYYAAGTNAVITFATDPTALYDGSTLATSSITSHKYTITAINADHHLRAVWS